MENYKMSPMIYKTERTLECLCEGYYKDYHFAIISHGTHPCAYVELPIDHKYYGRCYDEIEDISCHGGLSYSAQKLGLIEKNFFRHGFWIGWDYAHDTDYNGFDLYSTFNLQDYWKKWTTEEIYDEVKDVIEQLIEIQKGN